MQTSTRKIDVVNPNEEFTRHSDILEACLKALASEGATIESCMKQYPEFVELGNLLRAAQAVQRLQYVSLSQVSKQDVRERMLAHYRSQQARGKLPIAPRQAKWLRPLKKASALVLFVTVMIDLTILIGITLVADRVLFANQPGLEYVFSIIWTIAFGVALYRLMVYTARTKKTVHSSWHFYR
jgi:hypothetical protein